MIEENSVRKIEDKRLDKIPRQTIYYPSELEGSCCGKDSSKSIFQKIKPQEERNFCKMLCLYCQEKIVNIPNDQEELEGLLPIRIPIFQSRQSKIAYTQIVHSTAIISIGVKVNLMIDLFFLRKIRPIPVFRSKKIPKDSLLARQIAQSFYHSWPLRSFR